MIVLVFDTETTGLPINYNASLYDSDNWPYIIQLSYIVFDCTQNTILHKVNHLIKLPEDKIIPKDSIAIHHITNEMCNTNGIDITLALKEFNTHAKSAERLVAHNISFDKRMIVVESIRNNIVSIFKNNPSIYCTMKTTKDKCKIERRFKNGDLYYKFPNLSELYNHLFKSDPKGAHDALNDVLICLRCYYLLEYKVDLSSSHTIFNAIL